MSVVNAWNSRLVEMAVGRQQKVAVDVLTAEGASRPQHRRGPGDVDGPVIPASSPEGGLVDVDDHHGPAADGRAATGKIGLEPADQPPPIGQIERPSFRRDRWEQAPVRPRSRRR